MKYVPFWDILPHPRTTSLAAFMAWSCTPAGSDCAGHSSGFSALSSLNSGNGWVFQSSSGACFPHYTLFVLVHSCHENFPIRCCYLIPWINFSTYPTPSILHSVFLVSVIGITLVIRVKIFKDVFILEKFTHVFNEILLYPPLLSPLTLSSQLQVILFVCDYSWYQIVSMGVIKSFTKSTNVCVPAIDYDMENLVVATFS